MFRVVNIEWDAPEDIKPILPQEIEIPEPLEKYVDEGYCEEIESYISDATGYLHRGFEIEEVEPVEFTVACKAYYLSSLNVPTGLSRKEQVKYIREHLDECPVDNLEWLKDENPEIAVTEEDIMR